MNLLTIKRNAGTDRVTFHNPLRDQVVDCIGMNRDEREKMNNFTINYWCKSNGYAPVYDTP